MRLATVHCRNLVILALLALTASAHGQQATLSRVDILPGPRVLHAPARWQQLSLRAHFSDGSVRDVTRLTVFSSSDPAVADVSREGLVEFKKPGEVAILCRYLQSLQSVSVTYLEPAADFVWTAPPEHNYIDRHVLAKLKMLSIQPSELCGDHIFLRRAYLDLCALLPSPAEVKSFLADPAADKRAKLIDRLLDRPDYVDYSALKWLDVLRVQRTTLHAKGVEAYSAWLRKHIANNSPFDKVVHELLSATGNTFSNGPANYFRAVREPGELAETTAQLFLGVRMQCAKCHNHPFEKWSQEDYFSLAAFFAGVQQKSESGKKPNAAKPEAEIISMNPAADIKHPLTRQAVKPRFLGGHAPALGKDQDPRVALADWLVADDNPFFARAVVNRLWYHLFGKGIIDPPDDIRDSNPAANEALLDALARDFVAHRYDVKHLLRVIMNSRTYQLSPISNKSNRDDTRYFSHTLPRVLTAEQLFDALCTVTEVPEKFAGMPAGTRAVQLPDNDFKHPFFNAISRPQRQLPCECDRETESSLGFALHMLSGSTLQTRLSSDKNRLSRLLAKKVPDTEMMHELFLAALSRPPRDEHIQVALNHVRRAENKRKAWEDVLWALFNSKEFLFRH